MNDWPIALKAEDSAPAPTVEAAPDLQTLHVELSDLLARAARLQAEMLDALNGSRDILDDRRLAKIWGAEAYANILAAIETREAIGKAQRGAGMLSVVYTSGRVG